MSTYCGPAGVQVVTEGAIVLLDSSIKASYPGHGLTYYNLSGNGKNGTLRNETMATEVPGVIRLNNTADGMAFGYDTIFTPTSISICAWVNLLDIGDRQILITKWNGWSFEISSGRKPYLRNSGITPQDLFTSNTIIWGEWVHIAGVTDIALNSKRMFLNGVLDNSVTCSGAISYNTGTFNIPYSNTPSKAKGHLGPVQIYGRGLTDEEVKQNFDANKERFGL